MKEYFGHWLFFSFFICSDVRWFRIFGYGLHLTKARMNFSERNGYSKFITIGQWRLKTLQKEKR